MIRPVTIAERALAQCVAGLMAGRAEQTARRVTAMQIKTSLIRKNQYENHGQVMSGMEKLLQGVREESIILSSLYIMLQDGMRGQRMTGEQNYPDGKCKVLDLRACQQRRIAVYSR